MRVCSEGELPEAGPGRGAAAGRRGQVPEAAGPAGVHPRRSGEDNRGGALPEGRVPGRRHHRGLLHPIDLPVFFSSVQFVSSSCLRRFVALKGVMF